MARIELLERDPACFKLIYPHDAHCLRLTGYTLLAHRARIITPPRIAD